MGDTPVSFDAIIQAHRQKKQNELLAEQILGSGRKKPLGASIDRKATASPGSLASRITKRTGPPSTAAKSNINGKWNHDLHEGSGTRTPPTAPRLSRSTSGSAIERGSRIYAGLQKDLLASSGGAQRHSNIRNNNNTSSNNNYDGAAQMSIRGMASTGPYVVIASNFAQGTTAADIEAAMAPVGGAITSCHLISSKPTVMAEIVFVERDGAENVIATFNNQKADGRLLYVYMKQGGPSPRFQTSQSTPAVTPSAPPPAPSATRNSPPQEPVPAEDDQIMEMDEEMDVVAEPANSVAPTPIPTVTSTRDDPRQIRDDSRTNRDQQRYDNGRSRTQYQDGRYGFGGSYERRDERGDYGRGGRPSRGLYSDGMYNGRGDYGRYRR